MEMQNLKQTFRKSLTIIIR